MTELKIDQVSRTFPARQGNAPTRALEPTNLSVGNNDFVTILGPSGCGKSTLLRIIAGLDRPTSGRVILDGREVTGPGADRGMVFQSYTLFPWLTVRENIAFGLRERGISEADRGKIADGFIHRVGLSGFENHWPKQLSGGMQQRTAIARALANDPKILLLDEPFGALDNQTRVLMQEMLLGIWERDQKTVLFVTHDIEEAIFLGSRVIVMSARPGRIKAEIAIDLPHPRSYKIKTAPEFVRLRVGLSGFENHWPKQLSGGMQQRTAIARALANDPKILLLDEPFGALDNQTRVLMQEMLLGIWEREQKTVLFVTHDIEEAIFLGSRVIVMSARPGRIKAEIAIDLPHPRSYKIKTAPEFVSLKERLVEEIRAEALKVAVDA